MINKIDIQLSDQCNRRCKWCPMLQYSKNLILSPKIILKLIQIINQYDVFSPNFKITLSRYNEPMLYPKLMKQYLKLLKRIKKPFKFTVNTNGDYIPSDLHNYIKDIDLFIINDYDNIDESKAMIKLIDYFHTYKILENMQYIPNENLIRCNFNNTTIEYFYNKSKVMNTRDRGGTIPYSTNLNWTHKNIIPRTTCDIIGHVLSIDVNGDIYPCCDLSGMITKHHTMCCGNILKDSFETILNNLNNLQPTELCKNCTTTFETIIGDKNDYNSR